MRKILARAMVAAVLLGSAPAAWACICSVSGRVVCTGTDTGVFNVGVKFVNGADWYEQWTSPDGSFTTPLVCGLPFDVTLNLTALGLTGDSAFVSMPQASCSSTESQFLTYEIDAPGCTPPPPSSGADCSPGYYKNHPEAWCTQCGFTAAECTDLVTQLSTRGPGSAAVRDGAKALIDACFGTAEASPCTDDNL